MRHFDQTYLGKDISYSTNTEETLLNNNELIIGGTNTGKTTSIVEPKLLHAQYSSYIIPVVKRKLVDEYKNMLKQRGYVVWDVNFENAYQSDYGFDIFDYLKNEADFKWLAKQLTDHLANEDFWNKASESVLAAEMTFLKLKLGSVSLQSLLTFHNSIQLDTSRVLLKTSVDEEFMKLFEQYPDNYVLKGWRVVYENPPKTASCIFSTVTTCLEEFATQNILELANQNNRIQIEDMADIRTVLFLTTSPVDKTLDYFVNLTYSLIFKRLFEKAQRSDVYRLNVPIRIICDDFACGSKIPEFDRYISVFRATGISVTILLQSESQLYSMYGENAGKIIINNCDTILYTGGLDVSSCNLMSLLTNRPYEDIRFLPLGKVIIVRRGQKAIFTDRYETYKDPEYILSHTIQNIVIKEV